MNNRQLSYFLSAYVYLLFLHDVATSIAQASAPALREEDLVLVIGTAGSRVDLAHASSRGARGFDDQGTPLTGVRTVIVLEDASLAEELQLRYGASHNETYLSWPDRPDVVRPGDSRVALAPWLAARALGNTFKWLLYGDDDTLFFLDAVRQLLHEYDAGLPYLISDVIWHKRKRYLMEAPRCLACHTPEAYRALVASRPEAAVQAQAQRRYRRKLGQGGGGGGDLFVQPSVPPAGCPCTPQLACEFTRNVTGLGQGLEGGAEQPTDRRPLSSANPRTQTATEATGDSPHQVSVWSAESREWGFPPGYPTTCDYPVVHGGSGVLLSAAAMALVPFGAALDCFYDDTAALTATPLSLKALAHGDRMLSLCFWMHGLAPTDPGLSLRRQEASNSMGRGMDSATANLGSLQRAAAGQAPNVARREWLRSVLNMVALHVRHSNTSIDTTARIAAAYPGARRAAEAALKALTPPPAGTRERRGGGVQRGRKGVRKGW